MKNYKITTLFIFLMTSFLVFGYINPLGNLTLEEVKGEAKRFEEEAKIAEIEENMYSERSPRKGIGLVREEAVDANLIMYVNPALRYNPEGEVELIEAIKYSYSDGTTEIVSYEGEVLKGR